MLRITCLGSFTVELDGRPVQTFVSDKVRALLIYLVVENQRFHRREHLAGLLWSDQPEDKALHNLRQALSNLRKVLQDEPGANPGERGGGAEGAYLLIHPDGSIQFNPASEHWLDVQAYREGVQAALAHYQGSQGGGGGRQGINIRRLRKAAALYQGGFLDQFYLSGGPLFDEWASMLREELTRQQIEVLARLVEYHERRAEYALAAQAAAQLTNLAPWEEQAHSELMRLLALDGQWAAAQAQFAICRRYLQEQLAVEPSPETMRLSAAIRARAGANPTAAGDALLKPRFSPSLNNLPHPAAPLVGRVAELDALADSLANPSCRLLTLVGPGGSGKTRLALEAAAGQVGLFENGVYLVKLSPLTSASQVVPAIADVVQLRFYSREAPEAQLLNFLQEKQMLLVLDNFEHLLDANGLVADMLERAPGLKIITTTRQPLSLRLECLVEVDGLEYPGDEAPGAPAGDHSALLLFEQTARRIQPRFDLQKEYQAVLRICQLLEGLPLGIELVGSWVRVQSCEEIAAQLAQGLDIATARLRDMPERHRSLRAAFDHSWKLLDAAAQAAFTRLAVFRGEFSAEAAAQVAGASAEILVGLVERSLVRRLAAGNYGLHRSVQQFAEEHFRSDPDDHRAVQQAHGAFYFGLLAEHGSCLSGKDQVQALKMIGANIQNIRAAWQWGLATLASDPSRHLPLVINSLGQFYDMRSWFQEGLDVFSAAVAAVEQEWAVHNQEPGIQRLLGSLLVRQGMFAARLSRREDAWAWLERGLELLRPVEDWSEMTLALRLLGDLAFDHGELVRAQQYLDEALAVNEKAADLLNGAVIFDILSNLSRVRGDLEQAKAHTMQGLTLYQRLENPWGMAMASNNLGILNGAQGAYDQAGEYFKQALEYFRTLGDRSGVARSLQNLSIIAYIHQDYTRARDLRLECLAICREIGFRWGIASTLKHLGDVEKSLGAFEDALLHYDQSLAMSRQAGDRKSILYTLNSLGNLWVARGDAGQARRTYDEALALAMEIDMAPVAVDVLCGIAEALALGGNREHALELLYFALQQAGLDEQTRQKANDLFESLSRDIPSARVTELKERAISQTLADVVNTISPRP